MPRMIQLSESERKSVLDLHKKNCFHGEIAKKINRSNSVVTNFLKDPLKYGLGKKLIVKEKSVNAPNGHILKASSNKTISCSDIIQDLNFKMSKWTIIWIIKTSNHLDY